MTIAALPHFAFLHQLVPQSALQISSRKYMRDGGESTAVQRFWDAFFPEDEDRCVLSLQGGQRPHILPCLIVKAAASLSTGRSFRTRPTMVPTEAMQQRSLGKYGLGGGEGGVQIELQGFEVRLESEAIKQGKHSKPARTDRCSLQL